VSNNGFSTEINGNGTLSRERSEGAGAPVGEAAPVATATESDGDSDLADFTLYQLTECVRARYAATRSASVTALHRAMDTGDALVEGQARMPTDEWETWATESCGVGLRMARVYVQLAKERPRIEAAIRGKSDLSIRGARALLTVKRQGGSQSNGSAVETAVDIPIKPVDPLAVWATLSSTDKSKILDREGRSGLAALVSPKLMHDLATHLVGLEAFDASTELDKAKNLTAILRSILAIENSGDLMECLRARLKKFNLEINDLSIALPKHRARKRTKQRR